MSTKQQSRQKLIVIVGQTAVGKSALAVKLARHFSGEIISADSRQIYKGLNVGTGKITKKEMEDVPHHLLDIANPRRQFTVAEYKKLAEKKIAEIASRGKIPTIVGGTGFYIDTLLGNFEIPAVPPNLPLRNKLRKKTAEELFNILEKKDPRRARSIERKNKIRLIRALEIVNALGATPAFKRRKNRYKNRYEVLKIGLRLPDIELKQKITIRLFERIREGMVEEVRRLHAKGLSWKRMEELGLEYRFLARHLRKKISKEEMLQQLERAIWQYARRQRTWFKRDENIRWFHPKEYKKIEKEIKKFLK